MFIVCVIIDRVCGMCLHWAYLWPSPASPPPHLPSTHTHTYNCTHAHIYIQYHKLPDITIGGFDYLRDESGSIAPIQMHLRQFSEAKLNASTFSYILDGSISESMYCCVAFSPCEG